MVPQSVAIPLPRLDLWLAGAMEMDPALRRFLARSGVEEAAVAAVRSAAAAAGIGERSLHSPAQIIEFFGAPTIRRADRLVYDSMLWPAHQFTWAISRWGDVGPLGLRLREPLAIAPMRVDVDIELIRAHLRPWHHTEHEVRCALGPADQTMGDPGSSQWLYVSARRRLYVQFVFSWGLLRDIRARPVPADTPTRGVRGPSGRVPRTSDFWFAPR